MISENLAIRTAEPSGGWHNDRRKIMTNFLLLSFCIGTYYGTIFTILSLASSQLGPELGGIVVSTLYASYMLGALLFSSPIVKRIGTKWGLCGGMTGYLLFILSFVIAGKFQSLIWLTLVGALVGGPFSAGELFLRK